MPLRKPRNAHGPSSPSSPSISSPPSSSFPSFLSSPFTATPPNAYVQVIQEGKEEDMFDPFNSAPRPRRKPYHPFSAFEPVHHQQGEQAQDRPTSMTSTASGYSYDAEPVDQAASNATNVAGRGAFGGQGQGKQRRSTLSFEIGGPSDEVDADEVPPSAPIHQHQRQHINIAPPPQTHHAREKIQGQNDSDYPIARRPSTDDSSPSLEPDSHPSSREGDSSASADVREDAADLVPPRPRFLADASGERASWSSQDSSLYPSSAPNSDTELVTGTASDSDREARTVQSGTGRGGRGVGKERTNAGYTPPTPRTHAYKRRSGSYTSMNNVPGVRGAAAAATLPPGAAPPSHMHTNTVPNQQHQQQIQTRAATSTTAPHPTTRRYSGSASAHRRSSSGATATAAAAAPTAAVLAPGEIEEIQRSESPSILNSSMPSGVGVGARRGGGAAPPSAFRASRTSFSGPSGGVGVGVPEDAHPLSPSAQSQSPVDELGYTYSQTPTQAQYGEQTSSVGHGSFVSAASGAAAVGAGMYAAHQYPHGPVGYQYPPSPPPGPAGVGAGPASPQGQGAVPMYPGGAAYPGGGSGYPYGSYSNVPPPNVGGGGGYVRGGAPSGAPMSPHNAFMANSAIARSSMATSVNASGSAVDLVPYAARLNGHGHGGASRRSSVDVGGFAPPQPPFAQAGAGGYPPSPGTPGTPELRHAGSLPRLREPFLSPASRRSSSVWAPPTPAMYTAGNVGYDAEGRANSGFFGGYAYNGVGSGSNTMLALPGKKEPLPSSALRRKISISEKPWIKKREKGERTAWWLTFCIFWIGVGVGAVVIFFGFTGVEKINNSLCSILDDDFSSFNTDTWTKNVSLGGFGNGEFQMTTDSSDNLYIKNGQLYIMPTLTSDEIGRDSVLDGYTYKLDGCTETWNASDCSVKSNKAAHAVVNPVKSARISTRDSVSMAYGKVEVVAKMPQGDWLWPAIWMLPKDEKYGAWPLSGEIDIVEARGNDQSYPQQGNNYVRSSLNWGPLPTVLANTFGWQSQKRSTYAASFHTYTFEWTSDFMRISVDSKLRSMLDLNIKKQSFWERGNFPLTAQNGSTQAVVQDIWEGQPNAAPFDQEFYLIIDLAVGGTSGWFPDKVGGKMWFDGSATAMTDFANDQDTWSATWPGSDDDRALRVDSVKMWKLC